jgi:hypothetical protein
VLEIAKRKGMETSAVVRRNYPVRWLIGVAVRLCPLRCCMAAALAYCSFAGVRIGSVRRRNPEVV